MFLLSAFVASVVASVVAIAPLYKLEKTIPNSYLVIFNENASMFEVKNFAMDFGPKYIYSMDSYKGFAGELSVEEVEKIRDSPLVDFVETDAIFENQYETQRNPTWGLDRVDQTNLPLDNEYKYSSHGGSGVDIYIVDTGVRNTHNEFGGRARSGYDFHNGNSDATDDNGHGTHVAGTTAGSSYGLAKSANVIGVKVLGRLGAGSTSNIVAGVDWVAGQHRAGAKSTANLSLGGGASAAMDNAVTGAVRAGVVMVLASGNCNQDARLVSPARVGGTCGTAITVNAADNRDARASFSNYGSCTDLFAPGVSITSSWHTSNSATNTISGTSMAAPHVCGAVAMWIADKNTSPAEVKRDIANLATRNVISNPGNGSPNLNLFSQYV